MIKWNLTFYQEPGTLAPTIYELNFTYGMVQPNTNGFKNGETKVESKENGPSLRDPERIQVQQFTNLTLSEPRNRYHL